MREMAKKATLEKDGVAGMSANDQWGIAAVDPVGVLGLSAVFANNGNFIIKNDKGALQYAMGSPIIRNTRSYMRDWIKNDNSIFSGETPEASREVWLQGNALFYSYVLGDVRKASELSDDFGILPFPLGYQGKEVSKEYKQFIDWKRSVICVPATLKDKDLDDIGYLLDSLAFSRVCNMLNDKENAKKYADKADNMAESWAVEAKNADGTTKLAFDQDDTYSMKYNLIWDKVFGLNLFDNSIAQKECKTYLEKSEKYGVPLDNRAKYTKSDWLVGVRRSMIQKKALIRL